MISRRQERVAKRIHHELSSLLLLESKDPRLVSVNITDVVVTPDLRLAKIYVSVLGGPEAAQEALDGLEHASKYLRSEVSQRVQLRLAPDLVFLLDESWQRGARIDELLGQIRDEKAPSIADESDQQDRD